MIRIVGLGIVAFLVMQIQKYIYISWWNRNLYVTLDFADNNLFEGEKSQLYEIIENKKKLPLPVLKVKFRTSRNLIFEDIKGSKSTDFFYRNDIFQIGGKEKITRTLNFTASKRGYYKINEIDFVTADLFLTTEMMQTNSSETYLYVYPKPFQNQEFRRSLQQLNGEILAKRHLLEDPFEYRGIREYQVYDDMHSINWKATAKTGDLKVNQKNYTALQTIRIFANVEDRGILKKEECVEASLQIVAGLAEMFLSQGIPVACYCNGQDIINGEPMIVNASAGSSQMERIYKSLARQDLSQSTFDFSEIFMDKLTKEARGTMTFLVSPNHYDDFVSVVSSYQSMGEDFIWLYPTPAKTPPELREELTSKVKFISV